MTFEEWMRNRGLSSSTIKKYVDAIRGLLTSWAKTGGLIIKPIDEIHALEDLGKILPGIKALPSYIERNAKGHGMYGAALERYSEFLSGASFSSDSDFSSQGPHSLKLDALIASTELEPFSPIGQEDGRIKVLREIVRRQGQPKFRANLIDAYESRCAISGCTVLPILEAAHITPYLGPATNLVSNGILLRADLHTLWDLGLIAIDPETNVIWVDTNVADSYYQGLKGRNAFQPKKVSDRPSSDALMQQWQSVNKRC